MTAKFILQKFEQHSADQMTIIGLIYDLWKADQQRHEGVEKCVDLLIECIKDQLTEGCEELETLQEVVRGFALDRAIMRKFDSAITHARHQAKAKNLEMRAMLKSLPDDEV